MNGVRNVLKIDADRVRGRARRLHLGQLVEHYGSVVYGGLLSRETGAPDPAVLEALRKPGLGVLRWPGGNFASGYHWRDGVGPRGGRPVRYDLEWQVDEPNTFGTAEYLEVCRDLGVEPYICANAGSGTAEEAAAWVEYCNRSGASETVKQRRSGGRDEPWRVGLWGIGNEVYGRGQIGRSDVGPYVDTVREYARLMKKVDPTIRLVAVGWEKAEWNFRLVKEAGEYFDYLALHTYHPPAAGFREAVALPAVVAEQIHEMLGAIDSASYYLKDRRAAPIGIALDEWNLQEWNHERFIEWQSLALGFRPTNPELEARPSVLAAGDTPLEGSAMASFLARRRAHDDDDDEVTLTDALYAACLLHEMLRNADRIALGGFSPMVNGKGIVGTRSASLVLRPTYHVFHLLGTLPLEDAVVLDTWLRGDGYDQPLRSEAQCFRRTVSVPYLDAACLLAPTGRTLAVSVVNRCDTGPQTCELKLEGLEPRRVRRAVLTADDARAANTARDPDRVSPRWTEEEIRGRVREVTFPPRSWTLLRYEL